MRPLKPAPKPAPAYPRLATAWRLLAGAPLALAPYAAHADATIPKPGPVQQRGNRPVPTLKGEVVRVEPPEPPPTKKPPPKPPCPPPLKGKMVRPDPPDPPPPPGAPPLPRRPTPDDEALLLLHPHDVDEPCFTDVDHTLA
jgi:hypothetical protein